ncbi:MAG: hypothetical protein PUD15_03935 [Prevotella sp.]|nr:hypothetical protein [Prevotella sp.]
MRKKQILTLAVLSLLAGGNVSAQQVIYGAYSGDETLHVWGTKKAEHYDLAIHIKDANLVGKKVTGVRLYFPQGIDYTALTEDSVFLTKTLALQKNAAGKKVSKADILSEPYTPTDSLEYTFSTPYTITEDGVYAGYTFTAPDTIQTPVIVVQGSNNENFYFHGTRSVLKWKGYSASTGAELAMQVLIDGVPYNAAALSADAASTYAQSDKTTDLSYTVYNQGAAPLKSIDYTYSVAGKSAEGHYAFATPVKAHYNKSGKFSVTFPTTDAAGNYTASVKITKVNGEANGDVDPSASSTLQVFDFLAKKRALLEEYTGTWCGFCPRGFVGLEHMNALYGNDFVCASYHNADAMQFTTDYPSVSNGFPSAFIDRYHETDAYCGDNYDGHFNIDDTYALYNNVLAPAELNATAALSEDGKSIAVTTNVKFAAAQSAGQYQLSYVLTADGLTGTGSSWDQHNYYPDYASQYPDDDMKEFTQGKSTVSGLTYNFVVVGWSGKSYIANSLPDAVAANASTTSTYTFDVSGDNSLVKASLIQHKDKLHVVAMLIDTTNGHVVNAVKIPVSVPTAIRTINDKPANMMNKTYYSVDGRKLAQPQKGLNIIKLENGKTFKAVME